MIRALSSVAPSSICDIRRAACGIARGIEHWLVDPARILIADDGELAVDASKQASLQMRDDPPANTQALVSLWQTNSAAVRTIRTINSSVQSGAAAVLTDVAFG